MPKYSLPNRDKMYLTIEIKGKTYNIPLSRNLKVKDVKGLIKLEKLNEEDQIDFITAFLGKYIGEDVVDDMEMVELTDTFNLWKKANEEAGGLELGES